MTRGMEESSSHDSELQTGTRSSTNLKGKKNIRTKQHLDRYMLMLPLLHSLLGPLKVYCVSQHIWLPHTPHLGLPWNHRVMSLACTCCMHYKCCHWSRFNNPIAWSEPQQTPPSSSAATDELHSTVLAFFHLGKLIFIICLSRQHSKAGEEAGGGEK